MRLYAGIAGGMLVLAVGCTLAISGPDAAPGTIRWGTSFGMCAGYCREDMSVINARVTLTRESWSSMPAPTQTTERALPGGTWDRLVESVDVERVRALANVYGCPDCADGGAEYVELVTADFTKRVTFEYGRPPAELDAVVRELRALRATFPAR